MKLTTAELANMPESFKKRNPHLYATPLDQLQTAISQSTVAPTLAHRPRKQQKGKGSVVIRCTLVAYRRRLLDDDNSTGSFKQIRDAIASTIGIDDGDPRIAFECGQVETKGKEGVVVKIEMV